MFWQYMVKNDTQIPFLEFNYLCLIHFPGPPCERKFYYECEAFHY